MISSFFTIDGRRDSLGISWLPALGVINDFIALFADYDAIAFAALKRGGATGVLSGENKNSIIGNQDKNVRDFACPHREEAIGVADQSIVDFLQ